MAEAANTMEQMEALKKILTDLNQSAGVQVINMVQDSFKVMDAQHQVLYQELQDIKQQLNTMQESLINVKQPQIIMNNGTKETTHSIAKDFVSGLEKSVSGMNRFISGMKEKINKKSAGIIKDFKAHGVIALSNISQKLGLKEMYKTSEQHFNQEADKAQKTINKIDMISNEINESKAHTGNIFRAMTGKELKAASEKQGILFQLLKATYNKLLQTCQKNRAMAHDMVVKIERLELRALDAGDYLRNKSVCGKLDEFKEGQNQKQEQQKQESQLDDKQKGQLLLEDKQHKRDDRAER